MSAWEIVGLILGSGVMVALVNLTTDRLKRRDAVKDKREQKTEKAQETRKGVEAQLEELRAETSEQFTQVDTRFKTVERKIDTVSNSTAALMQSSRAQAYDRIRYLAMNYIKTGSISMDELRNLTEMHAAYQQLGGDGFLDRVMAEVGKLRIKSDD